MTFNYPHNPTDKEKEHYKIYFETLANTLPCEECRESYSKFIKNGVTILDSNALKNRSTLTKWLYYIHEAVNKKLNVNYGVSYDDIVKKYEAFEADCAVPIKNKSIKETEAGQCMAPKSKKAESYKADNIKDCPIIPIKMARHFIKYAQMRGVDSTEFIFIKQIKNNCKQDHKLWTERNKQCTEIFKDMRINDKLSIETSGKWEGLPTIDELKLILRFSTNLDKDKLVEIIKKLEQKFPECKCEYQKIYRLIK
jgi:hypothetical protein